MLQSSSEPDESRPISAGDALPPVEPPSARFLLQLFVVPAVIVAVVVLVWLLFTWVARGGDDPRRYMAALQRSGPARWQVAVNLANALRDTRRVGLKRDHQAAGELAAILAKEIEAAQMEERPVALRVFLCRALGEFQVDDPLPVLLRAATTQRHPSEAQVRRSAIEAIAVLAENVARDEPPGKLDHPDLVPTMLDLARDRDEAVRSTAAFAMGVLGSPPLLEELERMLVDLHPDARYNAATGLARHGNAKVVPVLLEMLDPERQAAIARQQQDQEDLQAYKRAMVMINGLRAATRLAQTNPQADLAPLKRAIGRLAEADVEQQIRVKASEALGELRGRAGRQ